MDVTLLPPSTILSNHSHLSLLPSPFSPPRRLRHGQQSQFMPSSHPCLTSAYRPRRRSTPCPPPPTDGRCILDELPDEIVCNILSYFDWEQLLHLRPVCQRWSELALSPSLHQSLTLLSLPPTPLPSSLSSILKHIRHLHLHLFPYPTSAPGAAHPTTALLALLDAIPPDQLVSLSLPFSAPYLPGSDLGRVLKRIGANLEHLDLRGSGLVGSRWTEWIKHVGSAGDGLKTFDLSFTSISTLPGCPAPSSPLRPFRNPRTSHTAMPMSPNRSTGGEKEAVPSIDAFRNLQELSLSSCAYLSEEVLEAFLGALPPSLKRLDVSRLEAITFEALWNMRVVTTNGERSGPTYPTGQSGPGSWLIPSDAGNATSLIDIKVVGIDHLTRLDIRRLKLHWESQRRGCLPVMAFTPIRPIPRAAWKTPKTPPMSSQPLSPPATPSPPGNPGKATLMDMGSQSPLSDHPFLPHHGLPTPPPDTTNDISLENIVINIVHSAILESEDVDGYRRFIGEVAGGVVPTQWVAQAHGHGVNVLHQQGHSDNGLVEVDGGGAM